MLKNKGKTSENKTYGHVFAFKFSQMVTKCPNSSRGKVSSVAPTTKSEIEKLKTKALMLPQEMKARTLTFHHDLIKIPVSH